MKKIVRKLPHVALIGLAAYGAAALQCDSSPYAAAACGITIISSMCALFSTCSGSLTESLLESVMDFVPLALMNTQFYLSVDPRIAYAHLLCMAVMFFDICAKIFGNNCDDKIIDRLKYASNIANVISLIYLSIQVDNYIYGVLAVLFLIRNFGSLFAKEFSSDFLAEMVYLIFQLIMFALAIHLLGDPTTKGSSDSKGSLNSNSSSHSKESLASKRSSNSKGPSGSKGSLPASSSMEETNTEEIYPEGIMDPPKEIPPDDPSE